MIRFTWPFSCSNQAQIFGADITWSFGQPVASKAVNISNPASEFALLEKARTMASYRFGTTRLNLQLSQLAGAD